MPCSGHGGGGWCNLVGRYAGGVDGQGVSGDVYHFADHGQANFLSRGGGVAGAFAAETGPEFCRGAPG